MVEKKVILIIDDEEQYRDVAVDVINSVVDESVWEALAPSTLVESMRLLVARNVKVVFIDGNIDSGGFQTLRNDGMTYNNVRGYEVARQIASQYPDTIRVAFSKGLGSYMEPHVHHVSIFKRGLVAKGDEGEVARQAFVSFLGTLMEDFPE